MPPLARRNLLHDKVRFAVTLLGVVFAVVLIVIELGLFAGFTETTSCLIDHSRVDLWVAAKHVPYVELGVPFNERKLYRVKAVEGVADAEKFINRWARWNRLDGGQETVQVVGFNPDGGMGGPWNIVEGRLEDLKTPDGVIVDEFYKKKLGVSRLGEVFEINGHRARVVGFTRGIRAFTTAPYVFTTVQHAEDYATLPEDQTVYVLVKAAAGAKLSDVRKNIAAQVEDVDIFTTPEFSRMTQRYWTFTTGAGIAVLLAAVLGIIVGFVVVAQTIYATTMDHLKEFGTLKALGAPNGFVCKLILTQAAGAGAIGYALGMAISSFVVQFTQPAGAPILMGAWMSAGTLALTMAMCSSAALVSIKKVTRLDPAMVFKG